MGRLKTGPLGAAEKSYILANAATMTAQAMAEKLARNPALVQRFIADNYQPLGAAPTDERAQKAAVRLELRNSHEWRRLREEFDERELDLFEEKYVKVMSQFKADVLPTEETQIFQAIKLEILMSRNLIARRRAVEGVTKLERQLEDYLRQFKGDLSAMSESERDFLVTAQNQLSAERAAEAGRTAEYDKLASQHVRLMKELKATRDQRVKEIESGKVSFLGLVKMLQQREQAEKEGRQRALMKMACEREYERLGRTHRYVDGSYDLPVLSADTVGLEGAPPPQSPPGGGALGSPPEKEDLS